MRLPWSIEELNNYLKECCKLRRDEKHYRENKKIGEALKKEQQYLL